VALTPKKGKNMPEPAKSKAAERGREQVQERRSILKGKKQIATHGDGTQTEMLKGCIRKSHRWEKKTKTHGGEKRGGCLFRRGGGGKGADAYGYSALFYLR